MCAKCIYTQYVKVHPVQLHGAKRLQPQTVRVCIRKPQNDELNLRTFQLWLGLIFLGLFPLEKSMEKSSKGFVKSMKPRGILGTLERISS